jgi:solute carrier family 8 (sodium/calcium exchanger)
VVICAWVSRGVVEIWEGLLTFAFFPATVLTAYIADRRLLIYKYLHKDYRMNRRGVIVETEGMDQADLELGQVGKRKSSTFAGIRNSLAALAGGDAGLKVFEHEALNEEAKEFEQHRREYIAIVRQLRKKHPDAAMETLEMMAREEIVNRGPKSRAFYRLQVSHFSSFRFVFRLVLPVSFRFQKLTECVRNFNLP